MIDCSVAAVTREPGVFSCLFRSLPLPLPGFVATDALPQ